MQNLLLGEEIMKLPSIVTNLQFNQMKKIPQVKNFSEETKLREAANDFEAIFVQQMLKTMRKTSLESNFIQKSEGEKYFRSVLDEHYAQIAAKSGSLGLGEMIYKQLMKNNKK